MKKASIIVLAILVMAIGAIAQVGAGPWNADGAVGHISHGCLLCHAPHSSGANTFTGYAAASIAATNPTWGSDWAGQVKPAKISGVFNNASTDNASIYLWGAAMTPQTYTTWEGTTISASGVTKANAVVHTLLCLSCHDNATGSHEMGSYAAPTSNMGFANPACADTNVALGLTGCNGEAIGNSTYNYNGGTPAWSNQASLQGSHPVHVAYTSGSYNWKLNADGTFVDNGVASGFTYGHPAKMWMEGGTAYVECTTCHDPHRETKTAFWNGTNYTVSAVANTVYYLRGPYTDPNMTVTSGGSANADFCRSCHYSKSLAYINAKGVAQ